MDGWIDALIDGLMHGLMDNKKRSKFLETGV
jgi:hypothetical protein